MAGVRRGAFTCVGWKVVKALKIKADIALPVGNPTSELWDVT